MNRIASCILSTLFLALSTQGGPLVQKPNTPLALEAVELTLKRVSKLPKREIPAALAEMAQVIKRRGVNFHLDQSTEESLRGRGANAALLGALRGSYREGGAGGDYSAAEAAGVKSAPARSLATAISAGVLNGRATARPSLIPPPAAEAAGATGTVVVRVLVDEEGNVISAKALSGHPLLQKAAEEAALRTRLKPLTLGGQPVIAQGILTLAP